MVIDLGFSLALTPPLYLVGQFIIVPVARGVTFGIRNLFVTRPAINIPTRLARVVPANRAGSTTLGAPKATDVFVASADDIAGITSSTELAKKLTLIDGNTGNFVKGPFTVIEFNTPARGLASPVFRTNPGFIPGGRTAGEITEFVIPNHSIDDLINVTIRTID